VNPALPKNIKTNSKGRSGVIDIDAIEKKGRAG
jgi:hypothetical protein